MKKKIVKPNLFFAKKIKVHYEVDDQGIMFRLPSGARDFSVISNVQTVSGSHAVPCNFRGIYRVGAMLTIHIQLAPRLRMNVVVHLLPKHFFLACTETLLSQIILPILAESLSWNTSSQVNINFEVNLNYNYS